MKALFVESYNGFLAKNATDDLRWSGVMDKKIFRLLTSFGSGVCVCSKHTYDLLPQKMLDDPARTYIVAEKVGSKSLPALNNVYPDAILIGGPAFIKVAYNMSILDTIVVTTTKSNITGDPKYKNPLIKNLRHPTTQIDFGDIIVRIYKAQHGVQK